MQQSLLFAVPSRVIMTESESHRQAQMICSVPRLSYDRRKSIVGKYELDAEPSSPQPSHKS